MSFSVVLTGGIASGKSTVANEFIALGVPVIDLDQLARDVVEPGTEALKRIVEQFGPSALDAQGRFDRRAMRERVFADPAERRKLEAITWPAIRAELEKRAAVVKGPYQIHAVPLYVEGGRKGNYDRVLVVDCPAEIQVERLIARDRISADAAGKIIAAQVGRDARLAAADDVLVNDGNIHALREQVRRLHEKYVDLAANKL